MIGITADGYGWDFIWQNIEAYLGGNRLWIFLIVFFLLVLLNKNKNFKFLGIYPYIIFFATVCNPLLIGVVGELMGLSDRYYRFFWLVPIAPMIGFCYKELADKVSLKWMKCVIWFAVMFVIVKLGTTVYTSAGSYVKRTNDYYTWDETIEIDKLLHTEGIERPKVLYSGWLLYDLRQYDPTVISVLGRSDLETSNTFFEENDIEELKENKDYFSILKWAHLAYYKEIVTAEIFREAVEAEKVNYIVISAADVEALNYYQICGCSILGEACGYLVLDTGI